MAVEDWLDKIAEQWADIEDPRGGNVTAYFQFKRDELPETITIYPSALSYLMGSEGLYSDSVGREFFDGQTLFFLTSDANNKHMAYWHRFHDLIRNAAVSDPTLNGTVQDFSLRLGPGGYMIDGPNAIKYGDDAPHGGYIVFWRVKVDVTAEIRVIRGL